MKTLRWVTAIVLLLGAGVTGLTNLRDEFRGADTPLQQSVAVGVGVYAILGIVAGIGLMRRRPWSVKMCVAFALVVVYVASVASIAWTDPGVSASEKLMGFVGAAIGTSLVGAFIVWSARADTRRENLPEAGKGDHIPTT
jgi:hypothetical protein